MPRFKGTYPARICPVCGDSFVPTTPRQIYCKVYCRAKAHRDAQAGKNTPAPKGDEVNFMLDEIKRIDAVAANDLMEMARMLAAAQAERLVQTAYRLMTRGGYVQAKNVLIEAGVIAKRQPRQRKINPKTD
jgi:hypothetical protein